MHEGRRARTIAYGLAVAAPLISLLIRGPLRPFLGDAVPHMTFFPAVMIAAFFGGLWPGLVATFLSAIAANVFLAKHLAGDSINDTAALILFLLVGTIISGLCESLHRARRRIVADERRRGEDACRGIEERFRQLAENIHEIFWMMDARDDRIIYISPGYEEVSGRTRASLYERPRSWVEAIHPDDRERMSENVEQYRKGIFPEAEFRLLRSDGAVRWMRSRAFPVNDFDGRVSHFAGLAEDITERKHAVEVLLDSEHRWRNLTEALPQLVWSAKPDGACDYFSAQWTQHTGIPESQLLGWRWLGVLHPDDREPTRQVWLNSVAGRGPYDVEYRVRRSDGEYRWFKTRGVPIRDNEGRIFKWFGTCTDITTDKQLEEELRQANSRLDLAVRGSNISIWEYDMPDGVLENANVRYLNAAEQLGYDRSDSPTTYQGMMALIHPDDQERARSAMQARLTGQTREYEAEFRVRHRDGSYRWVLSRGVVRLDAAGKPILFAGSRTDITEQKRNEEQSRQLKEAAEAANRAKDEFLANVSHEIRTPMNAILGMTELTLETPLSESQRQSLRTVKSAADNLLGIINDLLDFSKIEAGKLELDRTEMSLRSAVADTLRALAMRAHKKGLELVSDVQPNVPDSLVGDAGRLRQVLLNLIGNAIKFTDQGEVVVRVAQVSGGAVNGEWSEDLPHPTATHLQFSVSDTGIGIPPEKQETIFRAFEQEDTSTTRKYGGTGLGLTIAARLVELMGGTISVESQPGRGSKFVFTARFGLQPQQPAPFPAWSRNDNPTMDQSRPPVLVNGLRVLVVDDNATNRHILEAWLRNWQMEPAAAGDGTSAIEALRHGTARGRPYAIALLDARMPDTDGLALAATIRQQAEFSATRIILLSSGDRPGDLLRSRELRINAHLLKPVQQEELLETIYAVMSRKMVSGSVVTGECSEHSSSTTHHSPLTSHLRILVAEDNEFNVQVLEMLLVKKGHHVRLAINGREALAMAEEGGFDVMLLDIHMPELDGFEVVQAIRRRELATGGHLPIIALTARSRKEDREHCLAAGMDDFLAKPVKVAELWAAIDRVAPFVPSPTRSESSLFDPQVLLAACGDDAIILEKICQALQSHLPEQMKSVRGAMEDESPECLREAAHKICGILAAFSTTAAAIASSIEDLSASGQLEECRPLVEKLDAMAGEIIRQLSGLTIENLRRQTVAV